jgi:hypothetical protein
MSFGITLALIDSGDRGSADISLADVPLTNDDGSPRGARASVVGDLPAPPSGVGWDGIDGLNARIVGPSPIADGGMAFSLVATRGAGRHRLGVQLVGVPANRPIRAVAWVKVAPGTRVGVNIRDGRPRGGGESANSGAAVFDPPAHKVVSNAGNVQASIEPGPGDWQKLVIAMRSADGVVVMYVGLLGAGDAAEFAGQGQHMMFGGTEIAAN